MKSFKIKKHKNEELVSKMSIYYQDECGIEINKKTWRVIIPDNIKDIKIKWFENIHNQRHIFWFLRTDGKIIYTIRKNKKTEGFLNSLYRLREKDKLEYIMVILDNASIHKSKKIKDYCKKKNIILVYLPPYSPELNKIEFLRKKDKRNFMIEQWKIWKEYRIKNKKYYE